MKVLHIEDRKENRLLVRKLLESQGMTVTDAVDGLAGLELARSLTVDLVLVDINIPRLNGYEVVTRLKSEERMRGIPIVAITAEGDRSRALALGFDGFIMKPIKLAGFVDELRAYCAGKRELIPEGERAEHLEEHGRETVSHLESRVTELKRANERLRELDTLKMEVLRNVSHELSTPLTPLMGYLKMLENCELGPLTEGQSSVLQGMDRSLARLKEVIDNLLNVTRFATGAVALERSAVLPKVILTRAVEQNAVLAETHSVTISVESEVQGQPAHLDTERMVEALRQLIENAVKFGPSQGAVHVSLVSELLSDGDRRMLNYWVRDEGDGIPDADRSRVLQPFFQLDGSATRRVGGAGLGLTIADRTARLHGGELIIQESESGGTAVCIRVPARPDIVGMPDASV